MITIAVNIKNVCSISIYFPLELSKQPKAKERNSKVHFGLPEHITRGLFTQ